MDAAFALARYAVDTTYERLPRQVVDTTKLSILDTLGVMLAASTVGEGVKQIVDLVKEGRGKRESTIIAFDGKVPCWMAAFANGAMGHPLDYDDTHDTALVHPTAAVLPAALAVAERVGGANGKDFISAVAVANDVVCRLGLAVARNPGWLAPQTLGGFGAAAAAGKLLRLSEEQMLHSLGIAYHQAAGNLEVSYQTGSVLRAIRDAFTGKVGVLSALMAQKGLTGVRSIFESKAGLYNLYFRGEYDPAPLTAGLGERFEGANVSFKPWPARRDNHPYIEATLKIMRENLIKADDIEEIVAVGNAQALCEPAEERRRPKTAIDAKVSLPFTVAVAAAHGKVVIADFLPEALKDAAVLQMAERIRFRPDSQPGGMMSGAVEMKTKAGKIYSKRVDFAYGHPQNPITTEDLVAKFRDCASYSAKALSREKVDQIIQSMSRLEEVEDIRQLIGVIG